MKSIESPMGSVEVPSEAGLGNSHGSLPDTPEAQGRVELVRYTTVATSERESFDSPMVSPTITGVGRDKADNQVVGAGIDSPCKPVYDASGN